MAEEMTIPIALTSDDLVAPGELYALSLALRRELLAQPVDSVVHAPDAQPEEGAKGILGPSETQLLVTVAQYAVPAVVPAIIAMLSAWLLRQKDQRLHIKIGENELDVPREMSAAEIEQMVKTLTKAAKQVK